MIITKDDKIEFKKALKTFERLAYVFGTSEYGYYDDVKNDKLNYHFTFNKELMNNDN